MQIGLYNAIRKSNAPRYFKDIVNKSELFGENIVNFKYQLFDVNHQYTKEELIKNNNITSAIFLLDQKVEPLEFLDRLKAVALEFNKLTDVQKMILKHWIRNTVDENMAENAVEILDTDKVKLFRWNFIFQLNLVELIQERAAVSSQLNKWECYGC